MHALSDSRERELRARRATLAAPRPSADAARRVDPLAFTEPDQSRGETAALEAGVSPSRLITAMAFLEGLAHAGSGRRIRQWWADDVRPLGCVESTGELRETGHAPLSFDALDDEPAALQAMLVDARRRVVAALEAALRDPAALSDVLVQLGLVRREPSGWVASVGGDRPLSDLLLALIVSDMLDRPKLYRERFALCRRCDRISFDRSLTGLRGCLEHPMRQPSKKGRRAVTKR